MGRWTPLILMAGGLAILLGTLLGISFPMGGYNTAQNLTPAQRNRASRVLPAQINVNSSGNAPSNTNNNSTSEENVESANESTDNASRGNVAQVQQPQNNNNAEEQIQEGTENTPSTTNNNQSTDETNQQNEPIRALW